MAAKIVTVTIETLTCESCGDFNQERRKRCGECHKLCCPKCRPRTHRGNVCKPCWEAVNGAPMSCAAALASLEAAYQ